MQAEQTTQEIARMFVIVYDENAVTVDAPALIRAIDMADCVPFGEVYQLVNATLEKCVVNGPWHKANDPLYIRVDDQHGHMLVDGYGTDH